MSVKVESGIQLLTRLRKKSNIENFYPILFEKGPKLGDFIELINDGSPCSLLSDMICELILPVEVGGVGTEVLIFATDGNFDFQILIECFKKKLDVNLKKKTPLLKTDIFNSDSVLENSLKKLLFVEIFDSLQFYVTIQNLENILLKNCNISMVIFDTLTAFYWSEQNFKLVKKDLYINSLLKTIQKITKDYNVTVLYTKPEYFTSIKECNEPSLQFHNFNEISYKIYVVPVTNETFDVIVTTREKEMKRQFVLCGGFITWL